jgi:peptidoglycan/LPS O-acetylase OafA/YrhL
MAIGYATAMVVLAVGFVLFALVISVLAFFEPQNVTPFFSLYVIPILTALGVYGFKAKVGLQKFKD